MEQRIKKTILVGEEFEVVLGENITTGYEWQLNYNEDLFDISDSYEPYSASRKTMGLGSKRIFTIKAKKTGNETIEFSYERPWKENSTIRKIIYEIDISEREKI